MGDKFGAEPAPSGVPSIQDLNPTKQITNAINAGIGAVKNVVSDVEAMNPLVPHGKYVTGARAIVRVNGKLCVFAFSITWTIRTEQDEIWTIDDYTAYELAPKRITVEGTIGGFHLPGTTPTTTLIAPTILSFLFHKYITIEVRDRTTNAVLFKTNKAVITSTTESLLAEQIGTITLNWKAIGWQDEQPVIMPPQNPYDPGKDGKPAAAPTLESVAKKFIGIK